MRTKFLVSGAAIALAGLFFWAVWPTMYRYEYAELHTELGKKKVLIRINRFSNGTEALLDINGWTKLEKKHDVFDLVAKEFQAEKAMKPVTDPKILAELNGQQAPMSSAAVPELPSVR